MNGENRLLLDGDPAMPLGGPLLHGAPLLGRDPFAPEEGAEPWLEARDRGAKAFAALAEELELRAPEGVG
jgi:hypothetical protein